MSFVGSYTVIGGGNPLWGPGVICKLHYQRDTGKELGPFLHFDGNSLKANGGDTDNGEKKKNMVLGRLLVKDILYPSVCENIRVRIFISVVKQR